MAFEAAHAAMDEMIIRARKRLQNCHARGGTDEDFLEEIIEEFVAEAQRHPAGAGAKHMAMSVYRMVIQARQIEELTEAVEMRDATLRMISDIENL